MYQYAELVHWMQNPTKTFIPASADIDMTNICDQDCYYCNSANFRKEHPTQKTFKDYIALLDKLSTWRQYRPDSYGTLHTITFTGGGEPTLFKGYERVIEHSIDLGFLTSLTTNASRLDKLVDHVDHDKIRRMSWIGVDVDAGSEELYETIRKSKSKNMFRRVMKNIRMLTDIEANVDIKILLGEHNHHETALLDIFKMAKDLNVRQIYFRPVLKDGASFPIRDYVPLLEELGEQYQVKAMYNTRKDVPRNYNRCHQMMQFPMFCVDGKIYVCCENKGNARFDIGQWDQDDFRDVWMADTHMSLYNSVNTKLCPPCRSHHHNNAIQEIINNPSLIETLHY
jgi:wyosine [tRNA(Phe)-imidazoG37] synthetase (radical SAM superfamily)